VKRFGVISGLVLLLVLAVVPVAMATDPYEGDIPWTPDDGDPIGFSCEAPIYGTDPDDATECIDSVDEDQFDMDWGYSSIAYLGLRWRGNPSSGWWRELSINKGVTGQYGPSSGNALLCADIGGTAWATKYIGQSSSSGGWSAFDHPTGARTYTGELTGYIFMILNYTYSDPQADCAAADPGAPVTGPLSAPFLSTSPDGTLEELEEFDVVLTHPNHNGEGVTCTMQTQAEYTGTLSGDETVVFNDVDTLESGIYGVECSADDGLFDDTEPEVGSVRLNVTVGAGLEEIVDSGCGAWYNIACHVGKVLEWAFVPDDDVVEEILDTASEQFPLSVGAEFIEVLQVINDEIESVDPDDAGFSFSAPIIDGGDELEFEFSLPCVYEPGVDTPCSPGDLLTVDGEGYGGYAIVNDDSGGINNLWGFREVLRTTLTLALYLGWAFGLFKYAERKLDGGGA
jgi:hypothetical protein